MNTSIAHYFLERTLKPHEKKMKRVVFRERTLQDDVSSVRHRSTAINKEREVSVPSPPKEPMIVWGDSIQRKNLVKDDQVLKECMKWPKSTDKRCHNCTYPFDGVPVPLPIHKDEIRNIYYCSGNFCSWQCSKAFNLRETSSAGRGNRNMYISILAYRMWIKILKDRPEIHRNTRSFCLYKIDPARPRFELKDYGGKLTIEEYRRGFCGVLPPVQSIIETSPLLTLRKMAIVPFINTDESKPVAPLENEKQEIAFRGIKRIETNRVQEFNNSFCERLKKAKIDPTLMKRRKTRDSSSTLLSSMGIKINKRSN